MGMRSRIPDLITAAVLVRIAWIDHKTMEIPDRLTILPVILAFVTMFLPGGPSFLERGIGALCIAAPMYLICLRIPEAFGDGDIFLIAAMGFYMGWKLLLFGVFSGFVLGGVEACCLLITKKIRWGEGSHIAFCPALCAGLLFALFFGDKVIAWYMGLLR